ncbi:MAG: hypothetical protein ARM1_0456 [Candidatus Micrarchaeota archaeon]|nr:MAG: hypothetical protein ARM1_0456 [Candidatus Micrarchaeota archaeon]
MPVPQKKRKGFGKKILILLIIIVIAIVALIGFVEIEISLYKTTAIRVVSYGNPYLRFNISNFTVVSYTPYTAEQIFSSTNMTPAYYSYIDTKNISNLFIFATLLHYIPRHIYIVNTYTECYRCIDQQQFISNLSRDLSALNYSSNITVIAPSNLTDTSLIQNNSIIIIGNGLLPQELVQNGFSAFNQLLNKNVSFILLIGSLNNYIGEGSIIAPLSSVPSYLEFSYTSNKSRSYKSGYIPNGISFYNASLYLSSGYFSNNISYYHVDNNSILLLGNYPDLYNTSYLAGLIARSIYIPYWESSLGYNQYNITIATKNYTNKSLDILNSSNIGFNRLYNLSSFTGDFGKAYLYIALSAKGFNVSKRLNESFLEEESFNVNGSILTPNLLVPGRTQQFTFFLIDINNSNVTIEPHISLYNRSGALIASQGLAALSLPQNSRFIEYLTYTLRPGRYILELQGYSNNLIAATYFVVPNINVTFINRTASNDFNFLVKAGDFPLTGLPYSIVFDGIYRYNGTIEKGLAYIPSVPISSGTNFSFNIIVPGYANQTYIYRPVIASFKINSQYIILAIVGVIAFILVVFVRAPNRDMFYIDVSDLPKPAVTKLEVKKSEIVSLFDKINLRYKWKYMPLTKEEIMNNIPNYIRYGVLPVSVTYMNVSLIISRLEKEGLVKSYDGYYIPVEWERLSGHDIRYLVIFRKIRDYLLSKGFYYTDIDSSKIADIITNINGKRVYIFIYSETSKFYKHMPLYTDGDNVLAFSNYTELVEFESNLYKTVSDNAAILKGYISSGILRLLDSDHPDEVLS